MKRGISVICGIFFCLASPAPARALDLGDILKGGALIVGGGALVKAIAGPINEFINTVTFNKGAKYQGYTKVVPIVSMGDGTHIGAVQVGGTSKDSVEKTQAVGQLEASFKGVRVKVLIPIDSLNPLQQFRRVQGVGVTAIIDVKI
ncbi:MAG: hypothetical protein LBQ42_02975 [Synergistaceae bacterium]|nr:hypothetical protein [Synergistaceae bacterium]